MWMPLPWPLPHGFLLPGVLLLPVFWAAILPQPQELEGLSCPMARWARGGWSQSPGSPAWTESCSTRAGQTLMDMCTPGEVMNQVQGPPRQFRQKQQEMVPGTELETQVKGSPKRWNWRKWHLWHCQAETEGVGLYWKGENSCPIIKNWGPQSTWVKVIKALVIAPRFQFCGPEQGFWFKVLDLTPLSIFSSTAGFGINLGTEKAQQGHTDCRAKSRALQLH